MHAVREDQWTAATPATEWSVADLVSHVIDEHRWVPPLLDGLDLESAGKIVEAGRELPVEGGVGANLAQLWDEAARASLDSWTRPGTLERTVTLSRGQTPARTYLGEIIFDLAVHGWDLGAAIGYPDPMPDDIVAFSYEQAQTFGDLSGSTYFKPPVPVPDSASTQDRLMGLTGRSPDWQPS